MTHVQKQYTQIAVILVASFIAFFMILVSPAHAAGFTYDSSLKASVYKDDSNNNYLGQHQINNYWYYFDPTTGAEATNQFIYLKSDNKTVYYNGDGHMVYGQQKIDGNWYDFDDNTGAMKTGFVNLGDKTVYYDPNTGHMLYDQQYINGFWYYFDTTSGAMVKGWKNISSQGKTVYYDDNGHMVYGNRYIDGQWYTFDSTSGGKVAFGGGSSSFTGYTRQSNIKYFTVTYGGREHYQYMFDYLIDGAGNPIFCINFYKDSPSGTGYTASSQADAKIAWIVSQFYEWQQGNSSSVLYNDGLDTLQNYYITQYAIHTYDVDATRGNTYMTDGRATASGYAGRYFTHSSNYNKMWPYVQKLLSQANSHTTFDDNVNVHSDWLNISNSSSTTGNSDNASLSYSYKSSTQTYSSNAFYVNYSTSDSFAGGHPQVTLSNAPKDAYIYDKTTGANLGHSSSNFSSSDNLVVRIPASEVGTNLNNIQINCSGSYLNYKEFAYKYDPNGDRQHVVRYSAVPYINTLNRSVSSHLSYTQTIDTPTKTVTDTTLGTSSSSSLGVNADDSIKYTVSQKLPTQGSSITGVFDTLAVYDKLDKNFTYKSATLTVGDTTYNMSYNSSTRELSYVFNKSTLNNSNFYSGQTMTLTINGTATGSNTSNTAYVLQNKTGSNSDKSGYDVDGYTPTNQVTTVVMPSVKEGVSATTVSDTNYQSILKQTAQNVNYGKTYHYADAVTVGGATKLDSLQVQSTLTSGVNPIVQTGSINSQKIQIQALKSGELPQNILKKGTLTYTVNGKTVPISQDKNVTIDLNQARTITWTANNPSEWAGDTIVMDTPVTIKADSTKLSSYKSDNGISISHNIQLIENNNVSASGLSDTTSSKTYNSNTTSLSLPNIYTAKLYKSIFKTNNDISGTVYVKLYANLVGKTNTSGQTIASVTGAGNNQDVNTSLGSSNQILPVSINSGSTASNSNPKFDVKLTSDKTSSDNNNVVLTTSVIKSEKTDGTTTTTTYKDDDQLYQTNSNAVQYNTTDTKSTSALVPEEVETYYNQDTKNSQVDASNEGDLTYVKLMELMNTKYQSSVSAKAGYGIKNDVSLSYFGRHLNNTTISDSDFIKNNMATTFSTDTDLTKSKSNESSKISNPTSELLDYDSTVMSTSDLATKVNSLSSKTAKMQYLTDLFGSTSATTIYNNLNSSTALDQASTDGKTYTAYNSLSSTQKSYIAAIDSETNSTPTAPKLYDVAYKFNKRLLSYTNDDKNGIEYYDTNSDHVKQNASSLTNTSTISGTITDGGYKFYTNQWLKLGNYATTYSSKAFGSNNLHLSLNRNLNIYGRRYLTRSDNDKQGNTYDDLSIQPAISDNSNGTGTTIPDGSWSSK